MLALSRNYGNCCFRECQTYRFFDNYRSLNHSFPFLLLVFFTNSTPSKIILLNVLFLALALAPCISHFNTRVTQSHQTCIVLLWENQAYLLDFLFLFDNHWRLFNNNFSFFLLIFLTHSTPSKIIILYFLFMKLSLAHLICVIPITLRWPLKSPSM